MRKGRTGIEKERSMRGKIKKNERERENEEGRIRR